MGRYAYALAVASSLSLCLAPTIFGQAPPPQPPVVTRPRITRPTSNGLERWRQMRPDERQRFQSNAERWLRLAPEEQRILRQREEMRRERARREAEAALRQSGLELEAERRAQYERRYIEERRRIEQVLRQEIEERRQREMEPVVERLKKEFGQTPSASRAGTSSPSVSPSK